MGEIVPRDLTATSPVKPYDFTPEIRMKVSVLASNGVPQSQIADYFHVDVDTLKKHCKEELLKAKVEKNSKIGGMIYSKAIEEKDNSCLIFWAKTQMGWKETNTTEIVGDSANPIAITAVDAPRAESREEWLKNQAIEVKKIDE